MAVALGEALEAEVFAIVQKIRDFYFGLSILALGFL